jgi:hypothetical protein
VRHLFQTCKCFFFQLVANYYTTYSSQKVCFVRLAIDNLNQTFILKMLKNIVLHIQGQRFDWKNNEFYRENPGCLLIYNV